MNGFDDNDFAGQSAGADPALTSLLRTLYTAPIDARYWAGFEQRVVTQVQETQLLQNAYAAPADDQYWAGLEQRVMTRVRDHGAWWTVLPQWRGAGMVAAAAALFLVGATTVREQQREAMARDRAAVEAEFTVFDSTIEPVNMAVSLRSPNGKRTRVVAPERYLDMIRP